MVLCSGEDNFQKAVYVLGVVATCGVRTWIVSLLGFGYRNSIKQIPYIKYDLGNLATKLEQP